MEPGVLYTSFRGWYCPLRMHTLVGGGYPSKMSAFLGGSSTERRGGKSPGRHPVVIKLSSCGGADGGRFSDPPPDPGVPLGRRSCVDSGDGRGWGSAAGAPSGGRGAAHPERGSPARIRRSWEVFPTAESGPDCGGGGRGDPPGASLLAHPSWRIPSPACWGAVGHPPPPRSPGAGGTSLAPYLPGQACGRPAAGVAGTGRRLPGLEIRTRRIGSQSWTGRRSGRASLSRSAASFS